MNVTWLAAFGAGVACIASPCVLPIVPSYLSYLTGLRAKELAARGHTAHVLRHGAAFVLGFSTVFLALGWAAGQLGQWFYQYQAPLRLVGGLLVILFGLMTLADRRPAFLEHTLRYTGPLHPGSLLGSWFIGLAFAAGWTPCVGPILGAIVILASTAPAQAVLLMGLYAAGLAVPFLLLAYALETAAWLRRFSRAIERVAGVLLIGVGLLLLTGELAQLAAWLTNVFSYSGL